MPLLLLFIATPIIEMYVLIRVGQWIGAWPTIGLVTLTAFIGLSLLRQQGFSMLLRGRARLDQGELPAQEMLEGLVLAIGGALLLTPGFVTDVFGFCCLLPPTRRAMVRALLRRGSVQFTGQFSGQFGGRFGGRSGGPFGDGSGGPGRGPGDPFGDRFGPHSGHDPRRGGRGPEVRRGPDGDRIIEGEWEREPPRDS